MRRSSRYRPTYLYVDDARLLKMKAAEQGLSMAEYLRQMLRGKRRGSDDFKIW